MKELTKSLNLFISILSAGIKIVTLAGRQEYTAASINNIGNLVISLVSMARAHEESQVKSMQLSHPKGFGMAKQTTTTTVRMTTDEKTLLKSKADVLDIGMSTFLIITHNSLTHDVLVKKSGPARK